MIIISSYGLCPIEPKGIYNMVHRAGLYWEVSHSCQEVVERSPEVTKLKKSRTANRNFANKLVNKVTDLMNEEYNEDVRLEKFSYLKG